MSDEVTPQQLLWGLAVAALLVAGFAAWAEHRRNRRRDLDRPGLVPWNLIQVLAILTLLAAAGLALKL
jgi:uncharacterized iron-regulated membrane protein